MRDNCCQHEITMLAEDRVNTSVPSSVYTSINNPEDTTSEVNIYIYRYLILYVNTILYISISDTVLYAVLLQKLHLFQTLNFSG